MLHRALRGVGEMQPAADVGAEQPRRAAGVELGEQWPPVVVGARPIGQHLRAGRAAAAKTGIELDHLQPRHAREQAPQGTDRLHPIALRARQVQGNAFAAFPPAQGVAARRDVGDRINGLGVAGQCRGDRFVAAAGERQHGAGVRQRQPVARGQPLRFGGIAGMRVQTAAAGLPGRHDDLDPQWCAQPADRGSQRGFVGPRHAADEHRDAFAARRRFRKRGRGARRTRRTRQEAQPRR